MKKRLLFLAGALVLTGCTETNQQQQFAPGAVAPPPGTVTVLREDPNTQTVPASLQKTLRFTGVDENGQRTFGPVTRTFSKRDTFENVPANTDHILIEDAADQSVAAEVPVDVLPGGSSFASDAVMHPRGVDRDDGVIETDSPDNSPIQVGDGFIQRQRSSLGKPGANAVMTNFTGFSVTQDLPAPYRTNTWLSPILTADNQKKIYLGSDIITTLPLFSLNDPNPPLVPLSIPYTRKTAWQLPVYPHPWTFALNRQLLELRPDNPDNGRPVGIHGLILDGEVIKVTDGAQIPAPEGGKANSDSRYGQIESTNGLSPSLRVQMGFEAQQIKVNRMGDYDAELILRAVDDPKFASTGLKDTAYLKMITVRGNPLLYFTANDIPQAKLNVFTNKEVTHSPGNVTVGGVSIAYDVMTAPIPNPDRTISVVLFYPAQSAQLQPSPGIDQTLTFSNANGQNFFALATLPHGVAVDNATINKLAAAAFSFPTGSRVTYQWNRTAQTVRETYTLATKNVLGLPEARISGLLPHHYQPNPLHNNDAVLEGGGVSLLGNLRYDTPRGELRIYEGGTFSCVYPYPGILPFMPALDGADAAGRTEFAKWRVWKTSRHFANTPPYTNTGAGRGQSAYNLGKFLERNMLAAASIRDNNAADAGIANNITTETRKAIELYFRQNPVIEGVQEKSEGQAPYYTLYDARVGILNQYPNGLGPSTNFPSEVISEPPWDDFGAISRGNDHHFHYGYFINAAAQVALGDPAWAQRWRDTINQMVFDVASNDQVNPNPILKFPRERCWDHYYNHHNAAGFSFADNIGNNEESISEGLNFWSGVILWAAATNQDVLLEHAVCHYAAGVHSSFTYWFDANGNFNKLMSKVRGAGFDPNWPGTGASRMFNAFTRWDTFFGTHPVNARGIVMIPVTPASFYHAMNLQFVQKVMDDYNAFVTKFDIDPLKPKGLAPQKDEQNRDVGFIGPDNQWVNGLYWYSHFAKYAAFADPANAITKYWNVFPDYVRVGPGTVVKEFIVPNDKMTDVGDSGVLTYHMVRYMQRHGRPDLWVKATNTPFFMVFADQANNRRTYVGFNHTNAAMDITFDDGTTIANVGPRSLGTRTLP